MLFFLTQPPKNLCAVLHFFLQGGSMIVSRTILVMALIGFALALTTGCQQKGTTGKTEQTVGQRAKESAKIVQDAAKRIQDSLKQAKTDQKTQ
jgi:hypothetical protein